MSTNAIVRVDGLEKKYIQGKVTVPALKGVSFEIDKGDFVALAGTSGSGKTTLLNQIGALDEPSAGKVFVDGVDTSTLSKKEKSKLRLDKIGFIFQSYNLIEVLTALENAEFVLLLRKMAASERHRIVKGLLAEVGLEGLEHRKPAEMSGGQQQRVAIARAIAAEPAIILADEPTANVDTETGAALLDLMERLNREKGVTFIFSTHDPEVMRRARRIIRLRDGLVESDEKKNGGDAARPLED